MHSIDFPDPSEWNAGLHEVGSPDKPRFRIGLKRVSDRKSPKGPVLLVHGASASSRTFEVGGPSGSKTSGDGLAAFLHSRGWDVWLLDWRGSGLLAPVLLEDDTRTLAPERFTLDDARDDLLFAVDYVKHTTKCSGRIPLLGHCIGGALVAQTVATDRRSRDIGSIVLTTLGLFFNSGFDDWVKGNERFLEEIWWNLQETGKGVYFISPWVASRKFPTDYKWPAGFERAYSLFKETPLAHKCADDFCHRACFMFGMPYRATDMLTIHDAQYPHGLWEQFGRMPLVTYMHCVQNLRRGWTAAWQADDSDTRYLVAEPFGERRVTLITGNENQVWHRDSIDRMYEWLRRELPLARRPFIRKHVLPQYAHQDLFWSSKAAADVYPRIEQGLAA
jgi:pimeloyl-ACP methyl ester carboxylesterase